LADLGELSRRSFLKVSGLGLSSRMLPLERPQSLAFAADAQIAEPGKARASLRIENDRAIAVEPVRTPQGYSLGTIFVQGQAIETPLREGVILFENTATGKKTWLSAAKCESPDPTSIRFLGEGTIEGVGTHFALDVSVPRHAKAIQMTYRFKFDSNVRGVQARLMFSPRLAHPWTCHM
jgi:hypothetical protein